ncbi:MAG: hypothetical protein ACQESS_09850, partial [Bacillota bacterium]
ITFTAFSLALIFVSLTLFRGTTNIINSLTVPIIIHINIRKYGIRNFVLLIFSALIISILFFFQQLVFIFIYALIALNLNFIQTHNYRFFKSSVIISSITSAGFLIGVNLTDLIFGTAITDVFASISGGNILVLLAIFAVQGILIGNLLLILVKRIENRIDY